VVGHDGDLRDALTEARSVFDAAGGQPLTSDQAKKLGSLMIILMGDLRPAVPGVDPDRVERALRLKELVSELGNVTTTDRLSELWRYGWLFNYRWVEGKSWHQHKMAALRSTGGRRNHYDIEKAIRILNGEDDDPFGTMDLTTQQRAAALQLYRNHKDLTDKVAVKAVKDVLLAEKKKGVNRLNRLVAAVTELQAFEAKNRAELEKAMADRGLPIKIMNGYLDQLTRTIDAANQLGAMAEVASPGARRAMRMWIEYQVNSVYIAIEKALDALEGPPGEAFGDDAQLGIGQGLIVMDL
jgi:hypothetical protein